MEINELDKLVDALPIINPNMQFESNNQLKTDQYLMQLLWNVKVNLLRNKNHFNQLAKLMECNYANRFKIQSVKMDPLKIKCLNDSMFPGEFKSVETKSKSQPEKSIQQPVVAGGQKMFSARFKLPIADD